MPGPRLHIEAVSRNPRKRNTCVNRVELIHRANGREGESHAFPQQIGPRVARAKAKSRAAHQTSELDAEAWRPAKQPAEHIAL